MNIFPIDKNPKRCVKMMCDQHIVKILTEAVEIYCSALSGNELYEQIPQELKYKNVKSPWVNWAKDKTNRHWLSFYIFWLNEEYKYRFHKEHRAFKIFSIVSQKVKEFPYLYISLKYPKEFLQLVDEDSKCDNSIMAYRNYYKWKREHFKRPMRWTMREVPKFLKGD